MLYAYSDIKKFQGLGSSLARLDILALEQHKRTDGKYVHPGSKKTVDSLSYARDDRLIFIKGCVEQYRNARNIFKFFEELPIEGIYVSFHGLKAPRAVAVS